MHASKRRSIEEQVLHSDQKEEDTRLMLTHEPDKRSFKVFCSSCFHLGSLENAEQK